MNHSPREQANTAVRDFLSSRDWSAQTPARQRILVAFLSLATARGFGSVTMRTLGRELDMKAPSLYSSFPRGKDEIVAESLRWFTHRFARDLLDAAEATILAAMGDLVLGCRPWAVRLLADEDVHMPHPALPVDGGVAALIPAVGPADAGVATKLEHDGEEAG